MTPRPAFNDSPDHASPATERARVAQRGPDVSPAQAPVPAADRIGMSGAERRAAARLSALLDEHGLGEFSSESRAVASRPGARERLDTAVRSLRHGRLAPLAIIVAGVIVAAVAIWLVSRRAAPVSQQGHLTLDTRPPGVAVTIDGRPSGTTPVSVGVSPGTHSIVLTRDGVERRTISVQVAAGQEMAHYLEMTPAGPVAALTGAIAVATDPPGARVSVDGHAYGSSPVKVPDLSPAEHLVSVSSGAGSAERRVIVERGGTASVVFQLPKTSAPIGGWIAVSSQFDVQILEGQDVIGTSGASRIMLSAGRHDLRFVNEALGYSDGRRVDVAPGRTSGIKVDAPKGTLSVNARPWAEVFIDGQDVGQTPLGAVAVPIGSHKVVFRHPDLGERQLTTVVTARGPNRIGVDYSKP